MKADEYQIDYYYVLYVSILIRGAFAKIKLLCN